MFDSQGRRFRKPPACRQCRKRKIGCDRVKPICGNCYRSGKHDCNYPEIVGGFLPENYTPPPPKNNAKNASSFNQGVPVYRTKETSQLLKDNPELASMEQIREFNTRQQLLNSQNSSKNENPITLDTAKFIPRTTTQLSSSIKHLLTNKKVISANDDDLGLNWIQGPAIMDVSNSNYLTKELILKEYNFIKLRLLELQDITGKKIKVDLNMLDKKASKSHSKSNTGIESGSTNDDELDNDNESSTNNKHITDHLNDEPSGKKKIKLSVSSTNTNGMDELNDFGNEILDTNNMFSVLECTTESNSVLNNTNALQTNNNNNNENNDLYTINDTPNCLFTTNYMIKRDKYLEHFYKKVESTITTNFNSSTSLLDSNEFKNKYLQGDIDYIMFPSKILMKDIIDNFNVLFSSEEMASILCVNDLDKIENIVNKFGRDPKFSKNSMDIETMVNLGTLSIISLMLHESISLIDQNSVTAPLKELFEALSKSTDMFMKNIHLIKDILPKREGFMDTIASLQFFNMLKIFEMISINNAKFDILNYDDIFIARKISLNYEKNDKSLSNYWNYIFKNYCYRNIFRGEIPAMIMGNDLHTSVISDHQLLKDFKLLEAQSKLLKYMHLPGNFVSVRKVEIMRRNMNTLFQEIQCSDESNVTTDGESLNNNVLNSSNKFLMKLIHSKYMLNVQYLLLLQYNLLKDTARFEVLLTTFLQNIQEAITNVFEILSYNSPYTKLFCANFCYVILTNITHYILSLFQQIFYSFSSQSTSATVVESFKELINKCFDGLGSILSNLNTRLELSLKEIQYSSSELNKVLTRLQVILKYWHLSKQDYEARTIVNQHSVFDGIGVFDNMEEANLKKLSELISEVASSIITEGMDTVDKPVDNDIRTLGISETNIVDIYSSFFV